MITVTLKPKRDYSIRQRHPWIFSGAVENTVAAEPGETVRVVSDTGEFLAWGAWSPESQIRIRAWSFREQDVIDEAWFANRVKSAVGMRASFLADGTCTAFRLICSESDGLPGVTADYYNGFIVCQISTVGAEKWKSVIAKALMDAFPCEGVYERSDLDSRKHEGLAETTGVLAGKEPPELIEILENGCRYEVNVRQGHKTGFYLDQRDNRKLVAAYSVGAEVLNTFCYTGGFGVAALVAGAIRVTQVDSSEPALEQAKRNTLLNCCSHENAEYICGNVFDLLRRFRDARRSFDLIVLDPPKFADTKAAALKAARGYKDINVLAMKLLRPGGILATFSCSGAVTPEFFRTIVAESAIDAGRDVQILHRLQQPPDHPEGLAFPEGLYLKGLLCRVN